MRRNKKGKEVLSEKNIFSAVIGMYRQGADDACISLAVGRERTEVFRIIKTYLSLFTK